MRDGAGDHYDHYSPNQTYEQRKRLEQSEREIVEQKNAELKKILKDLEEILEILKK